MPYFNCTTPFSDSGGFPQCTGTSQPETTLIDTGNYAVCDVQYVLQSNGFVQCPTGFESKLGSELQEVDYLFQADSYTDVSGFINSPVNLTSSLYQPTLVPPTNDQSLSLNGDLLEVLIYASLSLFVIGLSLGGFISHLRKIGQR